MKYSGSALYMYIAPSGVRIIEGMNRSGSIIVDKFFKVIGVDKYFEHDKNSGCNYEIINVSELVADILEECKNRHTKSRKVFIVSNCCGIETTFSSEQSKGSLKSLLTAEVGSNKQKDKNKETKNKQIPGKMQSKTIWGDAIIDGKIMKYSSTSIGDKYFLKTLVSEFYNNNYEVIAISDTVGQLINLKQTVEATFDNQGKIIVDLDSNINILTMVRDIPVEYESQVFTKSSNYIQKIFNLIKSQLTITGRNPIIYLTGEFISDFSKYNTLANFLESEGFEVYDMFERDEYTEHIIEEKPTAEDKVELIADTEQYNEEISAEESFENETTQSKETAQVSLEDDEEQVTNEIDELDNIQDTKEILTPDYSVCFACMLTAFSKQSVNVVPPIGFNEIVKKNSNIIAKGITIASAIILVMSAGSSGIRFVQMMAADNNPSMISTYNSRIQELQMTRTKLEETMQTLTQADVMILDIISFVNANQSDLVNVISIDTTDMLTTEVEVTGNDVVTTDELVEATEDVIEGASQELTGSRAPVIIRGYAKTGTAAIDYYNKLFKCGLSQDPVLNGVEKYTLPAGQEVYIFEIQVGGDAS